MRERERERARERERERERLQLYYLMDQTSLNIMTLDKGDSKEK